ncbi:MAG: nucleotidyl transferase AbiEii/AbiGii toxin family protein [Bacteriovoracia bacterium]
MILHKKKKDFTDAIEAATNQLGIREVYIEKDYWVTYVLKNLSKSEFKDKVVFKGGTSLSKAHKMIERFSEDVDLALLLDGTESGGQVKKMIKDIEATLMTDPFASNDDHAANSKGSKFRKTAHKYPRFVKSSNFGHAYDHLILEINSFANPTPYKKMKVSSMLAEFFQGVDDKLIDEYELQDVEINVLDTGRTFTEKVMGLVRAGYGDNPTDFLRERIRHIYDLHRLLYTEEIKSLLNSGFDSMIEAVREDDRKNNQFQGPWMDKKLSDSLLFKDPKGVMTSLESYYKDTFSTLVYGDLPKIDDLIESIEKISEELKKV